MKKTNPITENITSGYKVLVGGNYRPFTGLFTLRVDFRDYDYFTENEDDNVGFRLCRTTKAER